MKSIISILLTACIASTLLIPTVAAPVTFSDVSASAWYYSDVSNVQQYGIIEGVGDNKFLPNAVLSYGQAVAMAARAYAYIHGETIPTLERWYEGPINYAIEKGVIRSQEIPSDINLPCDRQTMANMFYMVIDDQENILLNNVQSIPDVELSGGSANIYALYRFGILAGSDKCGTFRPQASITRAETAAIINRILDQDKRKTFTLEKKPMLLSLDLSRAWTHSEEYTDSWFNEFGQYEEFSTLYKTTIAFMNDGKFYGFYYTPNSGFWETFRGNYIANDIYLDMTYIFPDEDPFTVKYEIYVLPDEHDFTLRQIGETGLFVDNVDGTILDFWKDSTYNATTCKNECINKWGSYSE